VEYSVDRFSDCEHRAYGALRATDRRSDPVSPSHQQTRAASFASRNGPEKVAMILPIRSAPIDLLDVLSAQR
jgi:hypothetical protein